MALEFEVSFFAQNLAVAVWFQIVDEAVVKRVALEASKDEEFSRADGGYGSTGSLKIQKVFNQFELGILFEQT